MLSLFFLTLLAKITLLLAAAWAVSLFLRRLHPQLESIWWRSVFVIALVLPIAAWQIEIFNIPVMSEARDPEPRMLTPVAVPPLTVEPGEIVTMREIYPKPAGPAVSSTGGRSSRLPYVLGAIYLLGLGVGLFRLSRSYRQRSRVTRQSQPLALGDDWSAILEEVREVLGFRREIVMLVHPNAPTPMGWGMRCATLILPDGSADWTPEWRRYVLLHELVHLQRWDTWFRLAAEMTAILYWFHPLIHLARKRSHYVEELTTDDAVLRLSSADERTGYAELLLQFATHNSKAQVRSYLAVSAGMARGHSVSSRIEAILAKQPRRNISRLSLGVLIATIAGASLLASGTQVIYRPLTDETDAQDLSDKLYTNRYHVDPVKWNRVISDKHRVSDPVIVALDILWPDAAPPVGSTAIYNHSSGQLVLRTTLAETRRIEQLILAPITIVQTRITIYEVPTRVAERMQTEYLPGRDATTGIETIHQQMRRGELGYQLLHISNVNQYNDKPAVKTAIHYRDITITDTHVVAPSPNGPLKLALDIDHQPSTGSAYRESFEVQLVAGTPSILAVLPGETLQSRLVLVATLSPQ